MTPLSSNETQPPKAAPPSPPDAYESFLGRQAARIFARGGSEQDLVAYLDHVEGLPGVRRAIVGGGSEDAAAVAGKLPQHGYIDFAANMEELGSGTRVARGLSMRALQGLTSGFGDEAMGALLGLTTGKGSSGGIDEYRAELERFSKEHGISGAVAEFVGMGLQLAVAKKVIGPGALSSPTAVGAAQGALYGAGDATGSPSDRAMSAIIGGATGGVLGAVIGVAARALSPITKVIAQKVANKVEEWAPQIAQKIGTAEVRARALLRRAVDLDKGDITALIADVQKKAAQGLPVTIADVGGDNVMRLAEAAVGVRGPKKQELVESLLGRQADQGSRMLGTLFRSTKVGLRNAYDAADAVMAARKSASDPLYTTAYQQTVTLSDRFKKLLGQDRFKDAYLVGRQIGLEEDAAGLQKGWSIPRLREDELGRIIIPDELPVRAIDYMKRGLDVVIENAGKEGRPALDRQHAFALRSMLNELLDEAGRDSKPYGMARAMWKGHSELLDAMNLGKEGFSRKPPEVVLKEIGGFKTDMEKEMYRLGATQHLSDLIYGQSAETPNIARRYFGGMVYGPGSDRSSAKRISALFESPDDAATFLDYVASEAKLSETAQRLGSTPTQSMQGPAVSQLIPFRPTLGSAIGTTVRAVASRAQTGWTEAVSDELANLYTRGLKDPNELVALLEGLRAIPRPTHPIASTLATAAANAIAGVR